MSFAWTRRANSRSSLVRSLAAVAIGLVQGTVGIRLPADRRGHGERGGADETTERLRNSPRLRGVAAVQARGGC